MNFARWISHSVSASNDDHGGDDDNNENDRVENEDGTGVDMN